LTGALSIVAGTNITVTPSGSNITIASTGGGGGLPLTGTGATVTANTPLLNLSETWNNAGVLFQGVVQNITNTASAATSRLLDLQVGGTPATWVDVNGTIFNNVASAANCMILQAASSNVLAVTRFGGIYSSGYISGAGFTSTTSDFSVSSNTTLASVPGLSITTLLAGSNYMFEVMLFCTTGASAGGVKVAIVATGGLNINSMIADAFAIDGTTILAGTQVTAFGSNIVASTNTGTTPKILIKGHISVDGSSGGIAIQFAQNASNATASVVKAGSYMWCFNA
jgi:hypothetical protein